jgi:ribosomal protein S14
MKYLLQKDKNRRQLFLKQEGKWLIFRSLLHNQGISLEFRKFLYEKFFFSVLVLAGSRYRIKNRCILTGRGGSISRKFRISRITFRELCNIGKIGGISRSSW